MPVSADPVEVCSDPDRRLPPFVQTASGHGRIEERAVSLCVAEPIATGFAFSRTIVSIQSQRTQKKTGQSTQENRYYLSSQELAERTPERWINLSRQHWAGVENRDHWRRDASRERTAPAWVTPRR
jgi:hypothetical protein